MRNGWCISINVGNCGENGSYPFEFSDWYQLPQHLPSDRVFFASGIYNNSLFAIGDFNSDPISILNDLSNLNVSYNDSYWHETDWLFDNNYGNVTEITCYNSFVIVDSLLYILAPGRDSINDGKMLIYDLQNREQINSSNYDFQMPDPQWETPCTVSNGTHIFGIGGRKTSEQSHSLQIYSILEDKWYLGANLTYSRYGAACEYSENTNSIYIFGGFDANHGWFLDSIEIYNVATNTWKLLNKTLSTERETPVSLIINNFIYIMGGKPYPTSVDIFDITSEILLDSKQLSTLNIKLPENYGDYGFNLLFDSNNNIVYKIGGWYNGTFIYQSKLECNYNESNFWEIESSSTTTTTTSTVESTNIIESPSMIPTMMPHEYIPPTFEPTISKQSSINATMQPPITQSTTIMNDFPTEPPTTESTESTESTITSTMINNNVTEVGKHDRNKNEQAPKDVLSIKVIIIVSASVIFVLMLVIVCYIRRKRRKEFRHESFHGNPYSRVKSKDDNMQLDMHFDLRGIDDDDNDGL